MRDIEIMLHDGMIGVKAIAVALSSLTTGNLNSKLQKGAKAFKMQDILPSLKDYISPPLSEAEQKEQTNNSLLSFMSQAPGADKFLGSSHDLRSDQRNLEDRRIR